MALRRFAFLLIALVLALPAAAQNLSFDSLERALRLNAYQKQRFDAAVDATHRAMFAIGMGALQAKARVGAELLKDRPDPNAFLMAQDELVEFSRPHVRNARDEWLKFYSVLDEEQLRVARDFVDEKLRLLEKLGAHLGGLMAEQLRK